MTIQTLRCPKCQQTVIVVPVPELNDSIVLEPDASLVYLAAESKVVEAHVPHRCPDKTTRS